MEKILNFEIVTPERVLLKEKVLQLTLPTRQGEITILPNHIPLVSILMSGVIEAKKINGETEIMSVSGGFVEVLINKVVILADTAEKAEEIDIKKVEEAKKRAEEIKSDMRHFDQERFANISAKISKELARAAAVKKYKKIKGLDK